MKFSKKGRKKERAIERERERNRELENGEPSEHEELLRCRDRNQNQKRKARELLEPCNASTSHRSKGRVDIRGIHEITENQKG